MSEQSLSLTELLRQDKRYKFEAYDFVFHALRYGHEELGLGAAKNETSEGEEAAAAERHLTGQELCEAIRRYALEQYGHMAKCVLNSWGVRTTADFGEIVFNLIAVGEMRKTESDRKEDFHNVFDFDSGLKATFTLDAPSKP